jgi:ankyrin repeat protein
MAMKTGFFAATALSLFLGLSAASAQENNVLDAAMHGDLNSVRAALASGADVNGAAGDGSTALVWAAHNNRVELVDVLLEAGVDVSIANEYGATALYVAAMDADAGIVGRLLEAGADANAALLSGETPLMEAARRGKVESVRLLLEHGANINAAETNGGQTALMWAVTENHPDVTAILLGAGAEVRAHTKGGFTALMFAAQKGDAESAQLLIAAGAEVNERVPSSGLTPIIIASAMDHADAVSVLLDAGADPDATAADGFASLHYAAKNEASLSIVRVLLVHGADPDIRLIQERREAFADSGIAWQGATPLLFAAEINNLDAIKALVDAGADPLATTEQGTNALILASGGGTDLSRPRTLQERSAAIETARYLVAHGMDVSAAGQFGWQPIHAAAYQGLDDVIAYLVSVGADPDAMDRFGQTALSICNAVITEGLGGAYYQAPRVLRRETADMLLALGATPLEQSAVVVATRRAAD